MKTLSLVCAAVLVLMTGCTDQAAVGGGAAPASSISPVGPSVDPFAVPKCPHWEVAPAYPGGAVPAGAVSIRVCPGEKSELGPPLWKPAISPPVDALTTGVAEVVADLNALPDWEGLPEETFCTQEGRSHVHYVIGYPDGTSKSVTYGYGECHLLELTAPGDFPTVDTVAKAEVAPFMDAVSEAIVEQRHGLRPGAVPAAPRCVPNARPYTTLPIQELDLGAAALCVLDGEDWRRAVLPPALMNRLTGEYAAAAETSTVECSSTFVGKVVGWSTWSDPVEVQLYDGCAALGSPWSGEAAFWTMSSQLTDDLLNLELGPPVEQR